MAEPLPSWRTTDAEGLRPFAETRLVVTDVDGTLLRSNDARLHERVESIRHALSHSGPQVLFTIATGRTFSGIQGLKRFLRLPAATPIILYNGSVVVSYDGTHLFRSRTIALEDARQIVGDAVSSDFSALAYAFAPDYLTQQPDAIEVVCGWSKNPIYNTEFNGLTVSWNPSRLEFDPSAIVIDTHGKEVKDEVACRFSRLGVSITRSGNRYLEVRPAGSDKGKALEFVAAQLAIPLHLSLAIGDNDNDEEMLRTAGIGVAVSGASERARQAAKYITRYTVGEGAVETLKLVKSANRLLGSGRARRMK